MSGSNRSSLTEGGGRAIAKATKPIILQLESRLEEEE
jgi:hypothetical protein